MRIGGRRVGGLSAAGALLPALGAALIVAFSWHRIGIPFSNPAEIVGPLSRIGFHPANNLLRFGLFVGVPTFLFWILLRKASTPLRRPAVGRRPALAAALLGVVAVWSVFRGIRQLLEAWNPPAELFHFGELLTPAWIFSREGAVWTGAFFAHGAFHDVFASWIGWQLAGSESLAGPVMVQVLLHSLWVPAAAYLLATIFGIARRDAGDAAATCLVAALLLLIEVAQDRGSFFATRDFLALVGLSTALNAALHQRRGLWFAAGLFVPLTLLHAIDRGTYLAITTAVIWAVHEGRSPTSRRRSLGALLAGGLAGVALWLAAFGRAETAAFLENYFFWARYKDYLDAYVAPGPLDWALPQFPLVWWAALAACLLLVWSLARPPASGSRTGQTLHLGLTVAGLLLLRNALGRSDLSHLQYSCALIVISLLFGFWRVGAFRWRYGVTTVRLALVAASLVALAEAGRSVRKLDLFIADELPINRIEGRGELDYLPAAARRAAPWLRDRLGSQPCLFVLPSEPAWYFHLRLRPCSRFYVTWFAAPAAHQREVIRDLERRRPHRILFESPLWTNEIDRIPADQRFPMLFEYLQQHYAYLDSFEGFVVYARRPSSVAR